MAMSFLSARNIWLWKVSKEMFKFGRGKEVGGDTTVGEEQGFSPKLMLLRIHIITSNDCEIEMNFLKLSIKKICVSHARGNKLFILTRENVYNSCQRGNKNV